MPNKLSTQTSPYLLQHANNPVNWYPWGEEALQLALKLDRPILLSIGYSACHWCHVMERESFEDEIIAAEMNELFVCIKVDREERPDLDKIYQSAHQMLVQRPGGWPLTVALTPDGHAPFFAGTYFPPEPRFGMPGFADVLQKVAAHYRQHRHQMTDHYQSFEKAMIQLNPGRSESTLPSPMRPLKKAGKELSDQFDSEFGGFGNAPKFPHPTQLELLLRHSAQGNAARSSETSSSGAGSSEDEPGKSLRMFDLSMRKMAEGGLFDQLGGGFYRYSVDRQWCIPHFEKMLYDNSQLLALYSDAYQFSGDAFYRSIAEQTAAWVIREMQQGHGGYASTLDADSEGIEGKYYVWSETDLRAVLSTAEYEAIEGYYGLVGEPNFEGKWHFNINPDIEVQLDTHNPSHDRALQTAKSKLLAEREARIRPALDDKILTAWNGMMIKGMARAAKVLGRSDFVKSAQDALDFVRSTMWQNGQLLVTSRNGEARLNGYLDDYAFLVEGIIELIQAKWRSGDLAFALEVCDAMLERFEDSELGGFFFTSNDHEKLLYRPKSGPDDAIPSGNGAAASVLFKLGHLLGNSHYLESAEKTLKLFAPAVARSPSVYGSLTMALQARDASNKTIIIRGDRNEVAGWQSVCQRRYRPDNLVLAIPTGAVNLPTVLALRKAQKKPTAYICRGLECSAPIDSLEALEEQLMPD